MTKQILYGGDYNPEQWAPEVWDEDDAAFDLAGITTVTLGVFAWAHLQPAEDRYDFSRLDAIVERASAQGRSIVLATPSGAMPPWLARAHPDACRVDFEGRRHVYGQRHNHCPSSTAFARLSVALAGRLAERYGDNAAVVAWHVGNEYGGACYCDLCAAAFRVWLRERYTTLDRLNDAWNTTFWSHTFTDWDEIQPPTALSEHWRGPNHTAFQGITLDYRRFMSDALLGGLPRGEGRDPRARPAHPRDHEPDGPVPARRLPPLGRAPRLRDVGQLPARGRVAAADGRPDGARARGDARPAPGGAVLGDGADPVDHGQPRRQRRQASGRPAGCGRGSPWRTARTRRCSSSCGSRAARARSTTAPSSTTRAGRTRGCSARSPPWARSWRAWGTPRSARGRPRAWRCCSTGTPGGRSRCPTAPTGTSATSTCSPLLPGAVEPQRAGRRRPGHRRPRRVRRGRRAPAAPGQGRPAVAAGVAGRRAAARS